MQGQTEAAAELFRRAAAGAGDVLALLKQEPGSLQSPLHPAELHVDALLGHAQMLAATQRCPAQRLLGVGGVIGSRFMDPGRCPRSQRCGMCRLCQGCLRPRFAQSKCFARMLPSGGD